MTLKDRMTELQRLIRKHPWAAVVLSTTATMQIGLGALVVYGLLSLLPA